MSFDLVEFGRKLRNYREQRQLRLDELGPGTGFGNERLAEFEAGAAKPTGDEVLILADFFQCDYRFFISNERLAAFQQTESLYRKFGDEFSKNDRRSIQEFFFLCECEAFLLSELKREFDSFTFTPSGTYYKGHGQDAAKALRRHFNYKANEVPSDVYADFRRLGFHVFRRSLENSNISGLTIQHPWAGTCILVNYSEDIYRQRFTAGHEGAHGILDRGDDVIVSFNKKTKDYIELRANTFSSYYLLPPEFIDQIPVRVWNQAETVRWASQLKVSTTALAIALKERGKISDPEVKQLSQVRVPAHEKVDPELANLEEIPARRKEELLRHGLSNFYVGLCFEAWNNGLISTGRVAEMLLVDDFEIWSIAELFNARPVAQ
ncbi:MAG: DNA-binding protein [Bryobacterales bacterium]|nr:DNA-binding protein [Bryobacterales bacterium]